MIHPFSFKKYEEFVYKKVILNIGKLWYSQSNDLKSQEPNDIQANWEHS